MNSFRQQRCDVPRRRIDEPFFVSSSFWGPLTGKELRMKRRTSELVGALALLAICASGTLLGAWLVWSQFGAWRDAGFGVGWQAPPDAYWASFFMFLGCFVFAICGLGVVNLVRYDLRPKRKPRKLVPNPDDNHRIFYRGWSSGSLVFVSRPFLRCQ